TPRRDDRQRHPHRHDGDHDHQVAEPEAATHASTSAGVLRRHECGKPEKAQGESPSPLELSRASGKCKAGRSDRGSLAKGSWLSRMRTAQNESAETTSPWARVVIAWKTPLPVPILVPFMLYPLLIVFLMNRVLPSAMVALIPPGWLLAGARLLKT